MTYESMNFNIFIHRYKNTTQQNVKCKKQKFTVYSWI